MSFEYHISSIADLESAGQGRPMDPGEHTCTVTEVREPRPKVLSLWADGRQCNVNVRSIMIRLARVDDPDQSVVDFFNLPDTMYPQDADRYFRGTSNEKDRHPNFHFRKAATFINKVGFPLVDGRFPDRSWNPVEWIGLDVILTAQVEKSRETNASQIMDGVSEAHGPRIGVKLFSYKATAAGLRRQSDILRVEQPAFDDSEIPF